jgi:hypothetical protein
VAWYRFDIGDAVRVRNEIIGLSSTSLVCKRKQTNILDPGDCDVQLDTFLENPANRDAELYMSAVRQSQQVAEVLNKEIRGRTLLDGRRKTAAVADLSHAQNTSTSNPTSLHYNQYGENDSYNAKVVWAGFVRSGVPFLNRLIVPSGRKVCWVFTPTESGDPMTTGVNGSFRTFDWPASIYSQNTSSTVTQGISNILNDSSFSLVDASDRYIKYIKMCIIPWYHPVTDEAYDLQTATYDRSSAFHAWIPPGTYKDLAFIALGIEGAAAGSDSLYYAGNLVMLEVPIRRSYLAVATNVGADTISIEVSILGDIGWHITSSGRVKIGSGPNEEMVELLACRSAAGNGFNESFRQLMTGQTLRYAHAKGEPVEEVLEGIVTTANTFRIFPQTLTFAFDVIQPTITP